MEDYIQKHHKEDIVNILKSGCSAIIINFDLTNLSNENKKLFIQIKYYFDEEYLKWKKATVNQISKIVQEENIELPRVKLEIDLEFHNHPQKIDWPRLNFDSDQLVEFKGYIFRASTPRKLELLREVLCTKCKQRTMLKADRHYDYAFNCSRKCTIKEDCEGKMTFANKGEVVPPLENTIDIQTFKVQQMERFTPKTNYYSVEVEGKLVDSCHIGDTVYILGTLEKRIDLQTKKIKRIVIRALSISKTFDFKHCMNSSEREAIYNSWIECKKNNNNCELQAREKMLKSIAPELTNCAILKLALLIILCTGGKSKYLKGQENRAKRMTNRDISHLLLIGLPGLGKSQLLKAASKISTRTINCIGSACSLAGLTASSYREDKETHVEAGALVLANQGICCIDEFNLLSMRNRGALHDAMEHQKFSFMQANLKHEINVRCNVIGSMNHKAEQTGEARNKSLKNSQFNIEPSLISRFDLVFFLEKPEDSSFDLNIIESILGESLTSHEDIKSEWNLEKLQLHVIGAKNLACEVTTDVHKLILNYYRFCTACQDIDESRKTMRLLKSLERLTIGHAKLMLRNQTKLIDAVTVIWLMEHSWSFGDLISQENVVTSEFPVGPSDNCIRHIFESLLLSELYETFEKEQADVKNDTICAVLFDESIQQDQVEVKEVKKLFNKTSMIKRRSDEKSRAAAPKIDDELPEALKRSFAINCIDDLFEDDVKMINESLNKPKQYETADSELFVQEMENFFFNEMDADMNGSINAFAVPTENMSTQKAELDKPSNSKQEFFQPTTSGKDISSPSISKKITDNSSSNNVVKKKSLGNLLLQKSKEPAESAKRRKLSNDDDIFAVMTDDLFDGKSEQQVSPQQKSSSFLGRHKAFEYLSQSSQSKQASSNAIQSPTTASISENLLALSNKLVANNDNVNGSAKNSNLGSKSMTKEELLQALDDELDLWN